MSEDNNTPPVTPPAPAPTPPAPTPPAADKNDDMKAQLEELKKRAEAAESQAAKLKKAQEDAAEAERQKNLTAEQKAAELEKQLKAKDREVLVERIRRTQGFADAVFDVVAPNGDTEDEIKQAYEAHKKALDEYVKASGAKPGQGDGTGDGAKPDGKAKNDKDVPYLVRKGLVKPKQAV